MADGFHPPLEDYLEAIHALDEEGVPVIQARLVERLGHSAQTVSETVHRLSADGYLERSGSGRPLLLTERGRLRAESVVRKHRLAERLLTDIIGLDWYKAHIEAGRWEHVISDEVEERLVAILDNPTTCPHGNPIPGSGAKVRTLRALSDALPGDHVRLERVTEVVEIDMELLSWLDTNGFRPGTDAQVRAKSPDGTLTLEVEGETLALGPALASQLFVAAAT